MDKTVQTGLQESRQMWSWEMSYRKYLLLNLFLFFFLFMSNPAGAALRVAVSIAPLQSLVASMMAGTRQPDLLMRQNVSPHSYQLTPSKAALLSRSDLVIWIGKDFERSLGKIIQSLPVNVSRLALGEAGCAASGQGNRDLHIWLDPRIAICMVRKIRDVLVRLDGAHDSLYRKNADSLIDRLKLLDRELAAQLAPLAGKRYLVFHDAYSHFEDHYGLKSAGFFREQPDRLPGARHLAGLRRKIMDQKIACIFTEPGFIPAQIRVLVGKTGLKTAVLDPLGARLRPGPDLYFELMRNLARNLRGCLLKN